MPLTCPECGVAGVNCVCKIIENAKQSVKELKMNLCNNTDNKGMTPVEINNPVDRRWRQIRDKANKSTAFRTALVKFDEAIHTRAEELESEMVETMLLGGLHPNVMRGLGE